MSYISRLFEFERRANPENPSTNLANPAAWLVDWAVGQPTKAGMRMGEQSALGIAAVWACVRVLAETLASLPLIVYERQGEGVKRRAMDHPSYPILHDAPNEFLTSFYWRETLQAHVVTWGNGYSEIVGTPANYELVPRRPDWVEPRVNAGGRLVYLYAEKGDWANPRVVQAEDMLHFAGLGFDGTRGYSVIRTHRENLGLTKAAEEYGAAWFGSGSKPGGILKHPGRLQPQAAKNLRDRWEQLHGSAEGWHRTAVLEEGMEWQQLSLPPEDSQFLETRKFQVEEVARMYRVPPHMIQHLERATFSNIEQQDIDFTKHSMRPWLVRWEQEINRKLFTGRDRGRFFAEFKVDGLLRGDVKTRWESYQLARNAGVLSVNDIRELENMNRIGPEGDVRIAPLNMVPLDQLGQLPEPSPASTQPPTARSIENRAMHHRRRIQAAFRPLVRDVAGRMVRRQVKATRDAIRRYLGRRTASDFKEWAQKFFAEHREVMNRSFLPVFLTFAEEMATVAAAEVSGEPSDLTEFVRSYVDAMANRHSSAALGQILALIDATAAEELGDILEARLGEWDEKTPDKIADRETIQAGSAFAKATWAAAGVLLLRWITVGDNCPLCNEMSGRIVGINRPFVREGESVGVGTSAPLRARQDYGHPPLHKGCDCTIGPV